MSTLSEIHADVKVIGSKVDDLSEKVNPMYEDFSYRRNNKKERLEQLELWTHRLKPFGILAGILAAAVGSWVAFN